MKKVIPVPSATGRPLRGTMAALAAGTALLAGTGPVPVAAAHVAQPGQVAAPPSETKPYTDTGNFIVPDHTSEFSFIAIGGGGGGGGGVPGGGGGGGASGSFVQCTVTGVEAGMKFLALVGGGEGGNRDHAGGGGGHRASANGEQGTPGNRGRGGAGGGGGGASRVLNPRNNAIGWAAGGGGGGGGVGTVIVHGEHNGGRGGRGGGGDYGTSTPGGSGGAEGTNGSSAYYAGHGGSADSAKCQGKTEGTEPSRFGPSGDPVTGTRADGQPGKDASGTTPGTAGAPPSQVTTARVPSGTGQGGNDGAAADPGASGQAGHRGIVIFTWTPNN
ncbi:hypothetical protein ACIA8I_19570 [Streptomyces rishiriensis]|uniref:hypothetical protein n=1 Tax=Streptomyces rishiriensis TaxID=68264 RepID=UPI0037A10FF6